jgi:hypothetical protein
MPLDFQLIEQSTQHALAQLEKIEQTSCPYIFFLEELLYHELLEKLLKYVKQENIIWLPEEPPLHSVSYLPRPNRRKLNWAPDTVIEEVHIVLGNITDAINKIWDRSNNFLGLSIWCDTKNFAIKKHTDNPVIDVALQVYLTESSSIPGTTFEYDNKLIQAKYQKNHGYIMDNQAKVSHFLPKSVSNDHTRYSVYAIWAKHINI